MLYIHDILSLWNIEKLPISQVGTSYARKTSMYKKGATEKTVSHE